MIQFENITKVYPDGFKALDDLNFTIQPGELFVLIGPSGCGKTTTMKMINRLIEPSSGQIFINNQDIYLLNPVELRRNIGYVIQHIGLFPHMTIGENVSLVPRLKKWKETSYLRKVDELLSLVGLDPETYRNRYPSELSGGQQQRIGVIRALAAEASIILMDEPFSALDPISREQLQEELVRLQREIKKTIVFVTHDMDEAIKIADRICIMKSGKIVQLDTPEHLLRHPANEFVRSFIGEKRLNAENPLPSIGEVMVRPITASPKRGMAEAIKIMLSSKVDSLIIINQEGEFLGIVRVWDIQRHFREEHLTLQDIMNSEIPTVNKDSSLSEAIEIMSKYQIAYLPVTDSFGQLLGVITRASLVDIMADQYST